MKIELIEDNLLTTVDNTIRHNNAPFGWGVRQPLHGVSCHSTAIQSTRLSSGRVNCLSVSLTLTNSSLR